jgi:hypothetical protein
MNRIRRHITALALWITAVVPAVAVNITNVVETGGDNEATDTITAKWTGQTWPVSVANEPVPGATIGSSYTTGLFGHEAPAFVDRNHRYYDDLPNNLPIPEYLVGGEYIMSGNDNRDNANYRLNVSVANPSTVYMLIDNRLGDPNSSNADPPSLGPTKMQWILDENWMPTSNGFNRTLDNTIPDEVGIDEGADGGINQWYSVYKKDVPIGTFTLRQPDNAGQNMYGVVIVSSGPPAVTGDTDGNGIVNLADFEPIRANFRKMVSSRSQGDLVSNGVVDFADFREWKSAFVGGGGSLAGLDLSLSGGVPEPATAAVLLIGLSALIACRNHRGRGC